MGCCNDIATALDTVDFDPTQHVNYAKGMVLGVDDFRQEFAYLSGRDQWLVRDAIGYGTASGLRVFVENDGTDGPRLHVGAGSAFVPSGKHVCVGADQCALIDKWLAKPDNAAIVSQLLNPASPQLSPPLSSPAVTSGLISLYLTLCYTDCLTRPVPVPGEPCRSEAELMDNSRVADDFRLELRKDPPVQPEEDALRDFVRWLHVNVQVVDTSPATGEAEWTDALRSASQAWLDAASLSPPVSPPASVATLGDYLVDVSPSLSVARSQMCEFLRVAFRFWVTELRPLWMARRCHKPMLKDQDCVLLARIDMEVKWVGGSPTGAWVVSDSPPAVAVDESTRPFIVHLRMLQEWALCGCECGSGGGPAGPTSPDASALLPDLSGDASGPIVGNSVTKVRGIDVVTTGASAGQLLGFNAGAWGPVAAPVVPAVPNLAGDASGPIAGNSVTKVRGVDVVTTGAIAGQFLGFNAGAWRPVAAPVVPTGQFVSRGAVQPYSIVAAGHFGFAITPGTGGAPPTMGTPTVVNPYNGLAVSPAFDAAAGGFRFTFNGYVPGNVYIVKITPWASKGAGKSNPFIAYFSDFVVASGAGPAALPAGFLVTISLNPSPTITVGQLMIEVSQVG